MVTNKKSKFVTIKLRSWVTITSYKGNKIVIQKYVGDHLGIGLLNLRVVSSSPMTALPCVSEEMIQQIWLLSPVACHSPVILLLSVVLGALALR